MSNLNNRNEEKEMFGEELAINTSSIGKIANIIISPSKALKAIKKKPNIIVPIFFVILIPALYYVIFWGSVQTQMIRVIEATIEMQGVELTQESMDLAMKFVKWTPVGVIIGLLFSGVFKAVYYYICSKIAKSGMTFKESMSLSFHVMIISSLSWALFAVLTLIGVEFAIELPITSLASLLPSSMNGTFWYGLALPIEVFSIWGIVITCFGLQIVGKMSKKASMISVVLALVASMLYSGGSLALTNLFNSLM